jgi:hypothetical protein
MHPNNHSKSTSKRFKKLLEFEQAIITAERPLTPKAEKIHYYDIEK